MFDFEVVKRQVSSAYKELKQEDMISWSLEEILSFFEFYYSCYEAYTGYNHPRLTKQTIKRCIVRIPQDTDGFDYSLDDYEVMVDKYFRTRFEDCDYSIVHFLSGDIRLYRLWETCL